MSAQAAAPPARLDDLLERGGALYRRLAAVRPRYVLGPLLVAQWIALLAFAFTVRHNGWLYYAGGDQLWHYTGAYLLAHGYLPPTFVGYGWSFLLLPIALFAGPNLVSALPALVLFNTLLLLPVALLCIYGIASRIAGRLFGYWAAALWIALPYLGILTVEPGYHQKYTELTLPHLVGLTALSDFPSMVGLLVSAYLCLRALDSGRWLTFGAAGFAAGYAIAAKPSSAIYLFGPAVLLIAVRWRVALPFVLGLAPTLLTLALWKYRGLGHLGAAPGEEVRVAAGIGDLLDRVHNPDLNSWRQFHDNLLGLREHFWVARVLEWLPIGGAVGLLLRSRRGFYVIVTWFTAFLAIKGSYLDARVEDASFFRILLPAFPAFLLLCASVALLFPGVRARPAPLVPSILRRRPLAALVVAAALLLAVFPVALIASARTVGVETRSLEVGSTLVPVRDLGLRATRAGGAIRLSWRSQEQGPARVFYTVLRNGSPSGGVSCAHFVDTPVDCVLAVEKSFPTRATSYTDRPGKGAWTYRVGVVANWLDDTRLGDIYVVSRSRSVVVP